MGRFRIKWADKELEYEGTDSAERYKEAFDYLKSSAGTITVSRSEGREELKKRGGRRQAIFAPEIQKLVDDEFFKLPAKRKTSEILRALADRGLPVSGKLDLIVNACKRMVRKDDLKGAKTEEGWVFWQE